MMHVVIGVSHGTRACEVVLDWPGGARASFSLRRWVFRCDPLLDPIRGAFPIADARAIAGTAGLIAGVQTQHRGKPYDEARNQDAFHGFKRNQFGLCLIWPMRRTGIDAPQHALCVPCNVRMRTMSQMESPSPRPHVLRPRGGRGATGIPAATSRRQGSAWVRAAGTGSARRRCRCPSRTSPAARSNRRCRCS